jgi:acetolactate synthase-1/2/3 large subunit
MSQQITVGELVAAALAGLGVRHAFGVVSIHNMPMLDAIGRGNAIRFVPSRGEAGAANMADGYARVSDGLGVVITSTGPGAANAVGGLLEARIAGIPLLHLTGQTATANIGKGRGSVHDAPDQLAMLATVCKAAYRIERAGDALDVLRHAAAEALAAPAGPVSVELPIDVQKSTIERPAALDALSPPDHSAPPPRERDLDTLADLVATAKRPLLWLGHGARRAGAEAQRLMDMGFGVVTSQHGRAIVPEDHPLSLGAFNLMPDVEALYGTCDLMIVAGSRLRGHETRDQALALPARRVRIDVDLDAADRSYSSDMFVAGDAAQVLGGLADRLDGRPEGQTNIDPVFAADVSAARAAAESRVRAGLGEHTALCDAVRTAIPGDAIWCRDITTSNTTWGNRLFPIDGPDQNVYSVDAGIGQGMQQAIGAWFAADGRKVVAMCGDGGFFLNVSEVWTAVQQGAHVVMMVMNDSGYGIIRRIQDVQFEGRRYYDDLAIPDLGEFAKTAGLPYWRASGIDAVANALTEAMEIDGPTLIDVDLHALESFPDASMPPTIRPPKG